jgi:DhnA family fructose-bisphosphate aldolase class Ia
MAERWFPALLLAADHRARGVITVERYTDYLGAIEAALPAADGILASAQPLRDLVTRGSVTAGHRTYLSLNRTGLAGARWELDDRLVASVERAAVDGWTGVKVMTRIDLGDPATSAQLELLGRVLEEAARAGLEVLVEAVTWRDRQMSRSTDDIVHAAVVAHDMGAPLLKVPVPAVGEGAAVADAIGRVVASVGVPVLFLGGPREGADPAGHAVADAVAVATGGGAGMAIGRTLLLDPDPAALAGRLAAAIRGG